MACACTACATTPATFTGLAGDGQSVEYKEGNPYVFSIGKESSIAATATEADGKIRMFLIIQNTGSASFEYVDANVTAVEDGVQIALISASQAREQADHRANFRRALAAVAGGLGANAAAFSGHQQCEFFADPSHCDKFDCLTRKIACATVTQDSLCT